MTMVTYKIRVNRPCRLFIDDEEIAILEELKLAKFDLPEGEYLRKVVAIDNDTIFNEDAIVLSGKSKLDIIELSIAGLEEAKANELPTELFRVADFVYRAADDRSGVIISKDESLLDKYINIKIPDQVLAFGYLYDVIGVSDSAFENCISVESIEIPNSVVSIGEKAFCGCSSLKNVSIPDSILYIGSKAFKDCKSLVSIELPKYLNDVGEAVFYGCSSLESIVVPEGVKKLNSMTFQVEVEAWDFSTVYMDVYEGFFQGCSSLVSIELPNTLLSIGPRAFAGCVLLNYIKIPEGVTEIGEEAFLDCTFADSNFVCLAEHNHHDIYNWGCKIYGWNGNAREIDGYIYEYGSKSSLEYVRPYVRDLRVSGDISYISKEVYQGKSFSSIIVNTPSYDSREKCNAIIHKPTKTLLKACEQTFIPKGILKIGEGAFANCASLTEVVIPEGVEIIEHFAFAGCDNLTSILIPSSIKSIGVLAFNDSRKLESLKYAGTRFDFFNFVKRFRDNMDNHNIRWSLKKIECIDGDMVVEGTKLYF